MLDGTRGELELDKSLFVCVTAVGPGVIVAYEAKQHQERHASKSHSGMPDLEADFVIYRLLQDLRQQKYLGTWRLTSDGSISAL